MGNHNYKFTEEFKRDAVAYYHAHRSEVSQAQVAKNLGVSLSAYHRWVHSPAYSGGNAEAVTTSEPGPGDLEAENLRLKKENDRLKEEREILKKAAAFFANEEMAQRK